MACTSGGKEQSYVVLRFDTCRDVKPAPLVLTCYHLSFSIIFFFCINPGQTIWLQTRDKTLSNQNKYLRNLIFLMHHNLSLA